MIFYGGTKSNIEKQMSCDHEWQGPFVSDGKEFRKCRICYSVSSDDIVSDGKEALVVMPDHAKRIRDEYDLLHEVEQLRARRQEALVIVEQLREEKYALIGEIKQLKLSKKCSC